MKLSENAKRIKNNEYISKQIAETQFNKNMVINIKILMHGKYLKINSLKNGH